MFVNFFIYSNHSNAREETHQRTIDFHCSCLGSIAYTRRNFGTVLESTCESSKITAGMKVKCRHISVSDRPALFFKPIWGFTTLTKVLSRTKVKTGICVAQKWFFFVVVIVFNLAHKIEKEREAYLIDVRIALPFDSVELR